MERVYPQHANKNNELRFWNPIKLNSDQNHYQDKGYIIMLTAIIHSENKIFMKDLQQIMHYLLSCNRNYKKRFRENRNTYRRVDISALLLAQDKNKLLYKKHLW